MVVAGAEQRLCACYKERQEFHKVLDLKDAGLVVYCHTLCSEGQVIQGGVVGSAITKSQDVCVILHNTKDVKVTPAEIIPALEKNDISCPRCRKLFEHAQKLLQNVKSVDKKNAMGVCDHCLKKAQSKKPCDLCTETVKKFLSLRDEKKEEMKRYLQLWLSKMRHIVKDVVTDKTKTAKPRAYSDLQIDRLCQYSPRAIRQPKVKQMFHSELHKSDSNLNVDQDEKEQKLRKTVIFNESVEPFAVTPYENGIVDAYRQGTSLVDSDRTFDGSAYDLQDSITRSKRQPQKQIIHEIPKIAPWEQEAKEEKDDSSIIKEVTLKLERDSSTRGSPHDFSGISDKGSSSIYVKVTPRKRHMPTPESDSEKYDISRSTDHRELGESKRKKKMESGTDIKGANRKHMVAGDFEHPYSEQYKHEKDEYSKIRKKTHDIKDLPKTLKRLDDGHLTDDEIKLQHKVPKLSHETEKPGKTLSIKTSIRRKKPKFEEDSLENILQKQFSYFFPKSMEKEAKKPPKVGAPSSQLIRTTHEKIRQQAEEEKKRLEQERQRKLEEKEKKRLENEEKKRLAEEKKQEAQEQKKHAEVQKRLADEEHRKRAAEEELAKKAMIEEEKKKKEERDRKESLKKDLASKYDQKEKKVDDSKKDLKLKGDAKGKAVREQEKDSKTKTDLKAKAATKDRIEETERTKKGITKPELTGARDKIEETDKTRKDLKAKPEPKSKPDTKDKVEETEKAKKEKSKPEPKAKLGPKDKNQESEKAKTESKVKPESKGKPDVKDEDKQKVKKDERIKSEAKHKPERVDETESAKREKEKAEQKTKTDFKKRESAKKDLMTKSEAKDVVDKESEKNQKDSKLKSDIKEKDAIKLQKEKDKRDRDEQAKKDRDEQAKKDRDEQAKKDRDEQAKKDRDEQAKKDRDEQAKKDRDEQAKTKRDEQAKKERDEQAKKDRDEQAKTKRDEQAKKDRDEKAKKDRDEQANKDRDEQAKKDREEQDKKDRDAQAKTERDEQAKKDRDEQSKKDRDEQANKDRDEQAKKDRHEQAKKERDEQVKKDREENERSKQAELLQKEKEASTKKKQDSKEESEPSVKRAQEVSKDKGPSSKSKEKEKALDFKGMKIDKGELSAPAVSTTTASKDKTKDISAKAPDMTKVKPGSLKTEDKAKEKPSKVHDKSSKVSEELKDKEKAIDFKGMKINKGELSEPAVSVATASKDKTKDMPKVKEGTLKKEKTKEQPSTTQDKSSKVSEELKEDKTGSKKGKEDTGDAQFRKLQAELVKEKELQSKAKKQEEAERQKAREMAEKKAKEDAQTPTTQIREAKATPRPEPPRPPPPPPKIEPKRVDEPAIEVKMNQIKVHNSSVDDLILHLVKIRQTTVDLKTKQKSYNIDPAIIKAHKCHHEIGSKNASSCDLCQNSELEVDVESFENHVNIKSDMEIIIGENIFKYKAPPFFEKPEKKEIVPIFFQSMYEVEPVPLTPETVTSIPVIPEPTKKPLKDVKGVEPEPGKGIIRYALSDRTFIDKGWTMLPTEKVVRKMNVYRMRPAHPEFDWFEHNKNKRLMNYDTGEKLAEFDDNGRGRWYYRNGRLALDYYDAEETNAQQRFVIYSSGEPDERGRSHPITILATFDYLGNGIVFDHAGKIRLKYNQTEGVVLDRGIGPVSHWKWHTLNDPPVLQQVMIDTQMAHKDPQIIKLGTAADNKIRPDNEEMLAIEFDNFIKEKSKKLSQKFKPFQIKMKALKINEHFSLKVLDQATVYLIFRDGSTNLKLNIGMILDHQEIVDTDTAEVGEVSNNLERFPARTDSLAGLQRSVAYAQRYERSRTERERRLRPSEPCESADQLTAAASPPLRLPLRTVPTGSTSSAANCRCRKPTNNLYYNTRLL